MNAVDDHNSGQAYYLQLGGTGDSTRNAMSGVIGAADNTLSIAPNSRTLNVTAVKSSLDWALRRLIDDAQDVNLDWENKQLATGGAASLDWGALDDWDVTQDLTVQSEFYCDSINARLSGAITVNDNLDCGSNDIDCNDISASTFTGGDFTGGNVSVTVGITANGNSGQSIANWTDFGVITGAIVEKEFQNVAPTDKVLVRV
jgi:hypothetical protein